MRWIPLEANPSIFNKFLHKVGVGQEWEFVDVFGMDSELLMMVPRPVVAVMLLYPISAASENKAIGTPMEKHDLMFVKQSIGNACGTVGLLHGVLNNRHHLKFIDTSVIDNLLKDMNQLTPSERGTAMETNKELAQLHEISAIEGQTKEFYREAHLIKEAWFSEVDRHLHLHQVLEALCHEVTSQTNQHVYGDNTAINTKLSSPDIPSKAKDQSLYDKKLKPTNEDPEFKLITRSIVKRDGRRDAPTYHGTTSPDSLLEDTCEVAKKFMSRDPENLNFNLIALCKTA